MLKRQTESKNVAQQKTTNYINDNEGKKHKK